MSFLNILPFSKGDPTCVNHDDPMGETRGRFKVVARRKSILFWNRNRSESLLSEDGANESTWLLAAAVMRPRKSFIERMLRSWWQRIAAFYVLPTVLVLSYAAIPFPLYPSSKPGYVSINFWFFLFVYYGIYNAVGLLWITKLFNLFAINWWSRSLGGVISFLLFWSVSLAIGSLNYVIRDDWGTWTLTWSTLTLCTMLGPVISGFIYTRRLHLERTRTRGHVASEQQKLIPFLSVFDAELPRSYTRFLWFMLVLSIGLGSFALGEGYAWFWLSTLPHSSADVLLYVYTWVGLIYTLDWLTAHIIESKIDSPSLLFMFKLYYALTHQIYVRNLYARLRSPQQFAVIQGASSFATVIVAPLVMSSYVHWVVNKCSSTESSIEHHRKSAARGFYLKTWAANTTMAAFLGWVTILHFGPNRLAYPYFEFLPEDHDDGLYSWQLTFIASLVVWLCEICSSFVARFVMRLSFNLEVDQEMKEELTRYPDLLPAGIILTVFVLMNMLSKFSSASKTCANLGSVYCQSFLLLMILLASGDIQSLAFSTM